MNAIEIYRAQEEIALGKYNECKARLEAVSKDNATERKALHIELGMYNLCLRAGLLDCGGTKPDHAEKALEMRNRFMPKIIAKYRGIKEVFLSLEDEEKGRFIAAIQAEIYMRNQIYENYTAELEMATEAGDEASAFELKIKIGVLENVFAAWEKWRKETGIYPNMFEE